MFPTLASVSRRAAQVGRQPLFATTRKLTYMSALRQSIPLSPHEREMLKHLYLEFRTPSDRYKRLPQQLERFVRRWNALSERHDSPGEVLHYIVTKRKNGDWVTLDGDYERLQSMPDDFLSEPEWAILGEVYESVVMTRDVGSDTLAFDDVLAREVGRSFAIRAGRVVHAGLLFAAIMTKRKRGEWLKLGRSAGKQDIGFNDIDEIAM